MPHCIHKCTNTLYDSSSLSILSDDRFKASSETIPPHIAIFMIML